VVRPADFHGDRRAVARVLGRFGVAETVAWFREIGVELKREPGFDKLFPVSDRARDVLDALLDAASRAGVTLVAGFRVTGVRRPDGGFVLEAADGRELACRRLVLATGGRSLPKSGSDGTGYGFARALGHSLSEPCPALVALVLDPHPLGGLSGVSFPAAIEVWMRGCKSVEVRGPVLVTHFGLSGPAALDVSRHWTTGGTPPPELFLSFFPGRSRGEVERAWLLAAADGGRSVASLLACLPARVARTVSVRAGLALEHPLARLEREQRMRLVEAATALVLPVGGTRGFKEAEVTAGGVPLAEVDPSRMASRRCPGLYLVGEILDVDGRIGGFNFQWAWSTGFIAGQATILG